MTGNPHKAEEMAAFLDGTVEVEHVPLDCPEYRDDEVGPIAREKARFAYETLCRPLIVDDTGFFVHALRGFPGPYAAYVLRTLGNEGMLRLLEGAADRSAHFVTAVAYADADGIRVFEGRLDGAVTTGPRGSGGFGYDPIFARRRPDPRRDPARGEEPVLAPGAGALGVPGLVFGGGAPVTTVKSVGNPVL